MVLSRGPSFSRGHCWRRDPGPGYLKGCVCPYELAWVLKQLQRHSLGPLRGPYHWHILRTGHYQQWHHNYGILFGELKSATLFPFLPLDQGWVICGPPYVVGDQAPPTVGVIAQHPLENHGSATPTLSELLRSIYFSRHLEFLKTCLNCSVSTSSLVLLVVILFKLIDFNDMWLLH